MAPATKVQADVSPAALRGRVLHANSSTRNMVEGFGQTALSHSRQKRTGLLLGDVQRYGACNVRTLATAFPRTGVPCRPRAVGEKSPGRARTKLSNQRVAKKGGECMAKVLGAADQEKCSEASATRRWVAGAKCDEDENTNHCEPRPLSAGVPTCQCLEPSSSRRWVAGAKCDDEQTKQHEGRPSDRHECAAGTDEAPCSRAPPQCSDAFESSACELELRGKGEPPKLRSRTPVAFNDKGEVLIARYVEDGRARTLVTEADSTTIIGKSTVESLVASTDDEVVTFMKALSNLGMFGLCYELGQTLIEISKILQTAREQRVFDIESAHYAFFGLEPDCDDRALDNSYRQMAKVMHPDKNGGTEEAKDLFQEMKQRYEALKEARSKTEGTPKDDKKESSEEQADDCCIQYDPSDRASMDTTVLKMLSQLRVMRCEESLIL